MRTSQNDDHPINIWRAQTRTGGARFAKRSDTRSDTDLAAVVVQIHCVWLYCGEGYDANGMNGWLNDLSE
jgi:hypothetical protein